MRLHREEDTIIPADDGFPEEKIPRYRKWYCILMNIIDYRYWFCKFCGYTYPWGLCFLMDCPRHGRKL